MTISKDRVKPSPLPDSWKLKEIFATGIVLGAYMAIITAVFFYVVHDTSFFSVSNTAPTSKFTSTNTFICFPNLIPCFSMLDQYIYAKYPSLEKLLKSNIATYET